MEERCMKKKPKISILFLIIIIACSMLINACQAQPEATTTTTVTSTSKETSAETTLDPEMDTSKFVKLKFYFVGGTPDDTQLVYTEINKKLKEKINAEIEPVMLDWGSWKDRYPLLFASGEVWDMIYTANWAFYAEQAARGGFWELTSERLQKFAPQSVANLPEMALQTTKVAGKNYMIPNNNNFAMHMGVIIRGDLREKYGLPEIKNESDWINYMDAILQNEPGMIPMADIGQETSQQLFRMMVLYPQSRWSFADNVGTLTYKFTVEGIDAVPYYEVPGIKEFLQKMVEWNKKGYWSQSAITYTGNSKSNFEAGKGAVVIDNINQANNIYQKAKTDQPDWKVEYVDFVGNNKLTAQGFLGNGNAINARSLNPERALMAIDFLGYDPELNWLIINGIPGVHADNVGTNELWKVKAIDTAKYNGGAYSTWGFNNIPQLPIDSFASYESLYDKYFIKNITYHKLSGFSFDATDVKTEIAAINPIITLYKPILNLGFNEDPVASLEQLIQELKAAGVDKVNQQILEQAQAYMNG
jgi:putative aldouronate transport system substrate-binding protein